MDEKSLSHTYWNCKYHIVLVPKYRRKVIYGKLRKDIRKIFWTKGYYVNTVGGNEAKVRKYIQDQELEDQMGDQLSFKEYEDPFRNAELDDDDSPEVPTDSTVK